MEVYIRQALPDEYRHVLREIKNKDIRNIVVDTKPRNIQLFLRSVSLVIPSVNKVVCWQKVCTSISTHRH